MEKWFKIVLIVLVVATVIWAMTFDWSMQEYYNYVCAWEKINYDRMTEELVKLNVALWLLCGWICSGVSFHHRQKNMKGN